MEKWSVGPKRAGGRRGLAQSMTLRGEDNLIMGSYYPQIDRLEAELECG